jgi:hypothetical protein
MGGGVYEEFSQLSAGDKKRFKKQYLASLDEILNLASIEVKLAHFVSFCFPTAHTSAQFPEVMVWQNGLDALSKMYSEGLKKLHSQLLANIKKSSELAKYSKEFEGIVNCKDDESTFTDKLAALISFILVGSDLDAFRVALICSGEKLSQRGEANNSNNCLQENQFRETNKHNSGVERMSKNHRELESLSSFKFDLEDGSPNQYSPKKVNMRGSVKVASTTQPVRNDLRLSLHHSNINEIQSNKENNPQLPNKEVSSKSKDTKLFPPKDRYPSHNPSNPDLPTLKPTAAAQTTTPSLLPPAQPVNPDRSNYLSCTDSTLFVKYSEDISMVSRDALANPSQLITDRSGMVALVQGMQRKDKEGEGQEYASESSHTHYLSLAEDLSNYTRPRPDNPEYIKHLKLTTEDRHLFNEDGSPVGRERVQDSRPQTSAAVRKPVNESSFKPEATASCEAGDRISSCLKFLIDSPGRIFLYL